MDEVQDWVNINILLSNYEPTQYETLTENFYVLDDVTKRLDDISLRIQSIKLLMCSKIKWVFDINGSLLFECI